MNWPLKSHFFMQGLHVTSTSSGFCSRKNGTNSLLGKRSCKRMVYLLWVRSCSSLKKPTRSAATFSTGQSAASPKRCGPRSMIPISVMAPIVYRGKDPVGGWCICCL